MEPVRYEVDLSARVQHLVGVRMVIPADLCDGAVVTVPTWTPGSYVERDYVHHLQARSATDGAGAPLALRSVGRTSFGLPAGTTGPVTIDLEWYANELTVRTNHVDDHHALLVPPATFPFVEGAASRPCEVTIAPTEGHRVWGLLPTADGDTDGRSVPTTYTAIDHLHLVDSAFEVGDLRHTSFDVAGVPHHWVHASHGGTIDLGRIRADVTAIAEQAIAVFDGELPIDSYTFLCVGGGDDDGTGGLEHRDGSVLMLPSLTDATEAGVRRTRSLITHEYLHLWNVKRMVPHELVDLPLDRPVHTHSLWVAEGWTAHYDDLLPTRAGLESPRTYLDRLRDDAVWVERTPGARRQSVMDASWHAWTGLYVRDENSANAGTSYYTHGAVLAACLDLLIRAEDPDGDGLDEAMRILWGKHGLHAAAGYPTSGYRHEDVVAALSEAAGRDLAGFVADHVEAPAPPPLEELLSVAGLRVERTTPDDATPQLGTSVRNDPTTGAVLLPIVYRDTPAWHAGVTGGDLLLAIDGSVAGPDQLDKLLSSYAEDDEVVLTVRRGPRLLRLPVTLGAPLPQLSIVPVDEPTDTQETVFGRWTGHPLSSLSED